MCVGNLLFDKSGLVSYWEIAKCKHLFQSCFPPRCKMWFQLEFKTSPIQ